MTKRIAIDARPLYGSWNGTTTYLQTVVEVLLTRNYEVTLLSDKELPELPSTFDSCRREVLIGGNGWSWEQRTLRRYLSAHDYDLYYVGSNKGLPLLYFGPTRIVLGLLDIIPIILYREYLLKPPFKSIVTYLMPQVLSIIKADSILTISQTSAKDIKRIFPFKNVTSILMKLPNTIKPAISKKKINQFAYVGGVDPRKKLGNLLAAFKIFLKLHPNYKLVLIGKDYNQIMHLINKYNLSESVILTGYISDKEKMKIISESRALVYPSLYEGYGVAIAEAMLANTPILAGRGGSQAEVGGDSVLEIDPLDSEDIYKKMELVLSKDVHEPLLVAAKKRIEELTAPSLDYQMGVFFDKQVDLARSKK